MQIKHVDTSVLSNVEVLNKLQKECLPGDSIYNVSNGWWWVIYDNDIPIGFCGVSPSSRWLDCCYLCRAGVVRSFRGRGLQKKLIRAREKMARKLGFAWAISDTYYNPASSNSLISCGYKLYEPLHPWGAKGTLYWRKKL